MDIKLMAKLKGYIDALRAAKQEFGAGVQGFHNIKGSSRAQRLGLGVYRGRVQARNARLAVSRHKKGIAAGAATTALGTGGGYYVGSRRRRP